MERPAKYEVALSFAGEQREYVEIVANELSESGISVFYDKFATTEMWGKNLVEFLHRVYEHECIFCVIFVSEHYKEKFYPTLEKRSVLSDEMKVMEDRILQIKFDNTQLAGIPTSTFHLEASDYGAKEIAHMILEKIEASRLTAESDSYLAVKQDITSILSGEKEIDSHIDVVFKLANDGYLEDSLYRLKRVLIRLLDVIAERRGIVLRSNRERFQVVMRHLYGSYPSFMYFWEMLTSLEFREIQASKQELTETYHMGMKVLREFLRLVKVESL